MLKHKYSSNHSVNYDAGSESSSNGSKLSSKNRYGSSPVIVMCPYPDTPNIVITNRPQLSQSRTSTLPSPRLSSAKNLKKVNKLEYKGASASSLASMTHSTSKLVSKQQNVFGEEVLERGTTPLKYLQCNESSYHSDALYAFTKRCPSKICNGRWKLVNGFIFGFALAAMSVLGIGLCTRCTAGI